MSNPDLVARYQASGRPEDFEALVHEWLPSIRRFLRLQLGADREACEDVQQEVLAALVPGLARFHGRSKFSTFLFRLVRNKVIDYRRRQVRQRRHLTPMDDEGAVAGTEPDPLDSLVQRNTAERLLILMNKLPPADRDLLYFREIEDLSEKEVSVLLGIPVGTLKSRLHRVKKKLFLQLEEGGAS